MTDPLESTSGDFHRSFRLRFVATFVVAIVSAVALGIVYAWSLRYLQINSEHADKAAIAFSAAFGCGIGMAIYWTVKLIAFPKSGQAALIGAIAAIVGVYSAWGGAVLVWEGPQQGESPLSCLAPQEIWRFVSDYYENGHWVHKPLAGVGKESPPIKGIAVALVWLCEFAVILFFAAGLPPYLMSRYLRYCDYCDRWLTPHRDVRKLTIHEIKPIVRNVLERNFAALDTIPRPMPGAREFAVLRLASCDGCNGTFAVSVSTAKATASKNGKLRTKTKTLVELAPIAADAVQHVRDAGCRANAAPASSPGMPWE